MLLTECYWVTGWDMCGIGKQLAVGECIVGAAWRVLLTEYYWVIGWDVWGIGKQLAAGECIVFSCMVSAAD